MFVIKYNQNTKLWYIIKIITINIKFYFKILQTYFKSTRILNNVKLN